MFTSHRHPQAQGKVLAWPPFPGHLQTHPEMHWQPDAAHSCPHMGRARWLLATPLLPLEFNESCKTGQEELRLTGRG